MWELSAQSRKIESDHPHVRVFKSYISSICVRALSLKLKDRVRSPSRTTTLQVLHFVDMCEGSLLKVKRPNPITLTYNESSSATSCWHVQGISPQSLETESDYTSHSKSSRATSRWHMQELSPQALETESNYPTHNEFSSAIPHWQVRRLFPQSRKIESNHSHVQWVFKYYVSLACTRALSSKFKDRVRMPSRTMSLQVLDLAGYANDLFTSL